MSNADIDMGSGVQKYEEVRVDNDGMRKTKGISVDTYSDRHEMVINYDDMMGVVNKLKEGDVMDVVLEKDKSYDSEDSDLLYTVQKQTSEYIEDPDGQKYKNSTTACTEYN